MEIAGRTPLPAPARTADEFHPLEVIGYFRRWRPGPVRDVLYTFIWNCLLAVLFFMIGALFRPQIATLPNFVFNVLVVNVIGYCVHGAFLLGTGTGLCALARRGGPIASVAYYTGMSTLGVVGGYMLVAAASGWTRFAWITQPRWIAMMGFSSLLISVILASIFFARERQARAEAELGLERLRAERIEREATHAHLRALQAQIEPHFLFNTLANVASLVDREPALAKRMLESFNRFLRSSLAATRRSRTTLAAEAELITAYLDVLQVRMGARLRYRVDVAPELAGFELASMLVQPVVENAIRHGLEPQVEGGEVVVSARREEGAVVIEVRDTGVGFGAATHGGLGLANLRSRLALLYGERSGLAITEQPGGGTVVALRIPQ